MRAKATLTSALLIAGMSLGFIQAAHADNYGCEVLLCMSNPAGPMAVAQCIPPIMRLISDRAKLRPPAWPSCPEASPTQIVYANRPYDDCPVRMTNAPVGYPMIEMSRSTFYEKKVAYYKSIFSVDRSDSADPIIISEVPTAETVAIGIGDGLGEDVTSEMSKVCYEGFLGSMQTVLKGPGTEDPYVTKDYYVVEKVTRIDRSATPRVADVYVDGKLLKSTRF